MRVFRQDQTRTAGIEDRIEGWIEYLTAQASVEYPDNISKIEMTNAGPA
jgi:hypothetical protein